jgi:hypothetical protein
MDFKDKIKMLGDRVNQTLEKTTTEEATKTAFILPLIQFLGYDIFNPSEVIPEFNADFGLKKGEKVDYAIIINDVPLILIEAKHHTEKLDIHGSQLFRYFSVTKSKFGILTNGIDYEFYTDLEKPNLMDEKPFFKFNMTTIKNSEITELKKFEKENFDLNEIISLASELKYSSSVYSKIVSEMEFPSDDFTKFFIQNCYDGRATSKVIEQFKDIIKKSYQNYINNVISSKLSINVETEISPKSDSTKANQDKIKEEENKVVTTFEEIESYSIIKSILSANISPSRVYYRDNQHYFSVLIDNNNRKTLCRLYLNNEKKFLVTFDENKKEIKNQIASVNDLFKFKDNLIDSVNRIEKNLSEII